MRKAGQFGGNSKEKCLMNDDANKLSVMPGCHSVSQVISIFSSAASCQPGRSPGGEGSYGGAIGCGFTASFRGRRRTHAFGTPLGPFLIDFCWFTVASIFATPPHIWAVYRTYRYAQVSMWRNANQAPTKDFNLLLAAFCLTPVRASFPARP